MTKAKRAIPAASHSVTPGAPVLATHFIRAIFTLLIGGRDGVPGCGSKQSMRHCRCAGCSSAIRSASSNRKRLFVPICASRPPRFCYGSFRDGKWRLHTGSFVSISISRPNASGRPLPFCVPRRSCAACSPSSRSWLSALRSPVLSSPAALHGMPKRSQPSQTPSPPSASRFGACPIFTSRRKTATSQNYRRCLFPLYSSPLLQRDGQSPDLPICLFQLIWP
jgi:hypothetical protein